MRGTVVTAVVTFVLTGVLFLVPMHLQLVLGYDAMGTGWRLTPFMLALVVGGIAAGGAVHRISLAWVVAVGLAAMTVGLAVLAVLESATPYRTVAVGLCTAGAGVGLVMAPVMDLVLGALPKSAEGIGSAVNNTARQAAGALGVAVLGSLSASIYSSGVGGATNGLPGSPQILREVHWRVLKRSHAACRPSRADGSSQQRTRRSSTVCRQPWSSAPLWPPPRLSRFLDCCHSGDFRPLSSALRRSKRTSLNGLCNPLRKHPRTTIS